VKTPVRIDFALSARDDLIAIREWYTSQNAPEVGVRQISAVIERIEQLSAFPDSGKTVSEFEVEWLRELELPLHRIVYRRDPDVATVVRVLRSERLMDPDLA
jgi:plasmid stabilization system protein ParE